MLGVVLVNYKNANDTIECLESLIRSTVGIQIVVVDNNSDDGSVELLEQWSAGCYGVTPKNGDLARLSSGSNRMGKSLKVVKAAELDISVPERNRISVIRSSQNGGFAAGNNLGLRHLLVDPQIDHFWILNNDTAVEADAAERLLHKAQSDSTIGMCGSTVRFYYRPNIVQALGGHTFNWLNGSSLGIGFGHNIANGLTVQEVERDLDFITGASMCVSRGFLSSVGLMNEDYFLYYEEMDWAARSEGRFRMGFEPTAIVYHKEGGSIGSSSKKGQRSPLSEYYLVRSRIVFIRNYRPRFLLTNYVVAVAQCFSRLVRLEPRKATAIARALFGMPPT